MVGDFLMPLLYNYIYKYIYHIKYCKRFAPLIVIPSDNDIKISIEIDGNFYLSLGGYIFGFPSFNKNYMCE